MIREFFPRLPVDRSGRLILGLTALVDLLALTLAFALANFETRLLHMVERSGMPWQDHYDIPGLFRLPLLVATIPVWLVIFWAFGLYRPKRIIKPSIWLVLSAVTVSALVAVLPFVFVELAKTWAVVIWMTSAVFVVAGRLCLFLLQRTVHKRPDYNAHP